MPLNPEYGPKDAETAGDIPVPPVTGRGGRIPWHQQTFQEKSPRPLALALAPDRRPALRPARIPGLRGANLIFRQFLDNLRDFP
jgi:hypothetical protein